MRQFFYWLNIYYYYIIVKGNSGFGGIELFTKEIKDKVTLPENVFKKYNMKKIAYFDIETTGFDKEKDTIILISLGWFIEDEYFKIKQYFAENLVDEAEILYAFGSELIKFDSWCSYNGMAFDEPFIKSRMAKNSIMFRAPEEHIDLYRLIRPYHKLLGMERCNLKTVEKYIGVERTDKIDGGMSVELYNQYIDNKDEDLKNIIMLHNYEDVLNLPKVFKILYEVDCNNQLKREDCITEKQLKYLKSLVSKSSMPLEMSFEKISKKTASRLIDYLINGSKDIKEVKNILNSNY